MTSYQKNLYQIDKNKIEQDKKVILVFCPALFSYMKFPKLIYLKT
ncbi:hypothetical protein RU98_GL002429 [Enterococcus caccae]|nr:hypothetical protein RU98_GL002429 [Enterococcus caccae]